VPVGANVGESLARQCTLSPPKKVRTVDVAGFVPAVDTATRDVRSLTFAGGNWK
jgi:hypothetical protein